MLLILLFPLVLHNKRQATKKPGKKVKKKELTFVGIHCRRTDHIEFEKKHKQIPVHLDYYFEAMDMFRDRMNNKQSKVVFVFVSDDMEWGKMKLGSKDKRGKRKTEDKITK